MLLILASRIEQGLIWTVSKNQAHSSCFAEKSEKIKAFSVLGNRKGRNLTATAETSAV